MIDSQSDLIRPFDDIIGFYFSMISMPCHVRLFLYLGLSRSFFYMIVEGTV